MVVAHRYAAILKHTTKDTPIELIYDRFQSVYKYSSRSTAPEHKSLRQAAVATRQKRRAQLEAARRRGASEEEQEKLMYADELYSETAAHYVDKAANHIEKVAVTLLWIHARDDPVRWPSSVVFFVVRVCFFHVIPFYDLPILCTRITIDCSTSHRGLGNGSPQQKYHYPNHKTGRACSMARRVKSNRTYLR